MVLWFRFFDLVVLLKRGALLHKFTFKGTFLKSVLVFWRIFSCSPRVIFTCQFAFCRAISAKLMQQVGSKPPTSHTLHSRPNAPVSLDFLPDLQPLCDCKIAGAFLTLPPILLTPTPLPPPPKNKGFRFQASLCNPAQNRKDRND